MNVTSTARNVRMSPKKVREITRQVQGMPIADAQAVLSAIPRKSARLVAKTLKTAIADASIFGPSGARAMYKIGWQKSSRTLRIIRKRMANFIVNTATFQGSWLDSSHTSIPITSWPRIS